MNNKHFFAKVIGLGFIFVYFDSAVGGQFYQDGVITLYPEPVPITAFSLIDQQGHAFNTDHLKGKWTFIFFGYTSCPDVCPMALSILTSLRQRIAKEPGGGKNIQFVFVSVDPKQDSPNKLKQYIKYYSETFLAVTGNESELDKLADQVGAQFTTILTDNKNVYAINHTGAVYLLDPMARFLGLFPPPHNAQDMYTRFKRVRKGTSQE